MTRRAVLVCPGRGSYNKPELGYLKRHHSAQTPMLERFEALRRATGQPALSALDGAARFSAAQHLPGSAAAALIFAASWCDAQSLADDIEIVAVTGNSMGWYSAMTVAGALSPDAGFSLVNTMGGLMEAHGAGGQVIVSLADTDWRIAPSRRAEILSEVAHINAQQGQVLGLSIDLGGALVLAGDDTGLSALDTALNTELPRLPYHAAFHTPQVAPVAAMGRDALGALHPGQPRYPLIDGRGAIWWPHASDTAAMWAYTLGAQVVEPYDFAHALQTAAREFAPDMFILTGPGGALGSVVAQSLIAIGWRGMTSRADFEARQSEGPCLAAMGRPDQRESVTGE